jgi:hypothetical protein
MKDLRKLRQLLARYFSTDELMDLCFTLNVDFDSLPGQSKESRIRELLQHLDRRDQVGELVQLCAQQRPHVTWAEDAPPAQDQQPAPAASSPPDQVAAPGSSPLTLEGSRLSAVLELKCDRSAYLRFMQAAFSLEELVQFIQDSDVFRQLAFDLPGNPSYNGVARQLFEYARRRSLLGTLFEALAQYNPTLYREHGPMIESAQLRINVVFDVEGDDTRLRALQSHPLSEETEQEIKQASWKAFTTQGQNR